MKKSILAGLIGGVFCAAFLAGAALASGDESYEYGRYGGGYYDDERYEHGGGYGYGGYGPSVRYGGDDAYKYGYGGGYYYDDDAYKYGNARYGYGYYDDDRYEHGGYYGRPYRY